MLEHIVMDYCAVQEDGLWSRRKRGGSERERNYQSVFSCMALASVSGSLRNYFNAKSQNVFSSYPRLIGM